MPTYSSLLSNINDVRVLFGSVGRGVEVQLGLAVEVRLQPSVVSASGWVFAAEGGYRTHPTLMHKEAAIPDTRPDNPP